MVYYYPFAFIRIDSIGETVKRRKKMENQGHTGQKDTEQWVSVEQVARHLDVKPDTVYKWLDRGVMPAHKVGRLWRFRLSEINDWVTSGEAKRRIEG